MSISHERILRKMEEQLHKAKNTNHVPTIREHVQSIKSLCEVILEEQEETVQSFTSDEPKVVSSQPVLLEKRLKAEDGANGDSIFDF